MAAAYRTQHQLEGVLCERFGQVCTASASRGTQLGLQMGTIYSLCYVVQTHTSAIRNAAACTLLLGQVTI